ncbi:Putative electron transport protein YccM [Pirellula sp. SH-Sr6A]|uniref:cytochrome c oxidase accessory protein CcoG n=1 Tax=Pirellula sp. SH-Sr6A TaxID=1632865 RepID=UPI00078ED57D|nr:cytochrome c oxidase accessory protein CcoG [Pirellula sp. SH-Sr6A]AMV31815.1 Putative electron transport protein YccM [Pirellula sp. SH-Sr6A]
MTTNEFSLPILSKEQREANIAACSKGCGNCGGTKRCAEEPAATSEMSGPAGSILRADEQVLPTLSRDGKRRWITPSLEKGRKWHARRWVAYGLIAFFVTLPNLRINGKPYVLLDIASREFTFLGYTFYPTDTPLLACIMLGAFFSIMLVTSLAGRLWCGWGCPHTVYLEYLFRPIDRLFDGTIGRGGKPRKPMSGAAQLLRLLVYLVCCMFLAHTFLSYFVGTDELRRWIMTPPTEHPIAFLVMAGATLGLMFHYLYFREQLCLIACPYGRFQSVMLDRKSLIVAYDLKRGEPRKKGKRKPLPEVTDAPREAGDCIDCGRCTAVCPTGIDIRNGLQLECIHCTQCIDACDAVMTKVGLPTGLIRYTSQDGLEGKPQRLIRPRTVIYATLVTVLTGLFFFILSFKFAFDARVLPASGGAPFVVASNLVVQNNFKLRLVNRSQTAQTYQFKVEDEAVTVKNSDGADVVLQPGETVRLPIDVHFPVRLTAGRGATSTKLIVSDSAGAKRELTLRLLGPR